MLKLHLSNVFALVLLLEGTACTGINYKSNSSPILGKWISYKIEGHELERELEKFEMEFRNDFTFTTVAMFKNSSLKSNSGSYIINGDSININIDDDLKEATFKFNSTQITITLPSGKSMVWLKRKAK